MIREWTLVLRMRGSASSLLHDSSRRYRPGAVMSLRGGGIVTRTIMTEDGRSEVLSHFVQWRLRTALRVCQWAANLCFLGAVILAYTPVGYWLGRALIVVVPVAQSDYIVILGGDRSRAVEGAQLYREGWAPKVIVTSNKGAKYAAAVARAYGVPTANLVIDDTSRRTADHPDAVGRLGGIDREESRLIIVTSGFHTSRAKACFIRAGYKNIRMRVPRWEAGGEYEPPRKGFTSSTRHLPAIVHELLAWVQYKLYGWV